MCLELGIGHTWVASYTGTHIHTCYICLYILCYIYDLHINKSYNTDVQSVCITYCNIIQDICRYLYVYPFYIHSLPRWPPPEGRHQSSLGSLGSSSAEWLMPPMLEKRHDQNHSCFELLGYQKVLKRIWTLKPEM